jgi:hypothetical protein
MIQAFTVLNDCLSQVLNLSSGGHEHIVVLAVLLEEDYWQNQSHHLLNGRTPLAKPISPSFEWEDPTGYRILCNIM